MSTHPETCDTWQSAFDKHGVPRGLRDGLEMWVTRGIPPGGFLQAVLCNDLRSALGKADISNRRMLFEIVGFLHNEAPMPCWGSRRDVYVWCAEHARSRLEYPPTLEDRRVIDDEIETGQIKPPFQDA